MVGGIRLAGNGHLIKPIKSHLNDELGREGKRLTSLGRESYRIGLHKSRLAETPSRKEILCASSNDLA